MYLDVFQNVGRKLAEAGLISGASGNLSIRLGGQLLITTHGSRFDRLDAGDLVNTGLYADDENTPVASFELPVHRAIYRATAARAVVHAHPACGVALTVAGKDSRELAGAPVFGENQEIIPGVLAGEIAAALKTCPLVMVRGHGSFAVGKTLDEALKMTLAFEKECSRLCAARGINSRPGLSEK